MIAALAMSFADASAPPAVAAAQTAGSEPGGVARAVRSEDTEVWTPVPPIVDAPQGAPPSDAVVLFDGRSLDAWTGAGGRPPGWAIRKGSLRIQSGAGDIATKAAFGDVQLHLEWRTLPSTGEGQHRSNSGVYLMGLYEVQLLDSFRSRTYANGQAGAVYKQFAPLVNVSRPPLAWQSYDIVFRAPCFERGKLTRPARMTVFHNGVLIQDSVELLGPTVYQGVPAYKPHAAELPIKLQEHGEPVEFRNIWVRRLR